MFAFVTNFLEPLACLLYFIAALIYYRRKQQKSILVLLVYYAVATALLLTGAVAVKLTSNNVIVYDLLGLFTSVFLGFYFYTILHATVKKKTVLLLMTVYVLYAIIRNIQLEGPRFFDSMGYAIVSASIVVYVFMYFHQVLKNVTEVSILREFNFWLTSGYLIYFAGNFIIFISYYYFTTQTIDKYVKAERQLLTALWGLHNVLLFISALSLLIGCIWINSRRKLASS